MHACNKVNSNISIVIPGLDRGSLIYSPVPYFRIDIKIRNSYTP